MADLAVAVRAVGSHLLDTSRGAEDGVRGHGGGRVGRQEIGARYIGPGLFGSPSDKLVHQGDTEVGGFILC